ncbi:uncharacterized protein LOC110033206 [Phalaenopsis equestris]|uniref:uncharacterized protein LOC110033206 n=1 Tax=Phalaenopsis equestris TaxID=78828 RepID=UPI0009E4D19D|nr:uncharacterized protein LOC110033206 [Phalaenopsis equestris]
MAHKIQSFNFCQLGRYFSTKGRRTHPAPPLKSSPVKVMGLDGRVKVYHRRIKVEELMKEHACHLLCRSDSFFIGQKLQALEAAEELQMGESYFILPSQFFQSVLSFVTIASSLAKIGGGCGGRDGGGRLRHFDIHKTDSGKLQIRISEEVEEIVGEEEEGKNGVLCTTKEMVKEYEKLVGVDLRRWRPKLEKIAETPEGKMRRRGRGMKWNFGGLRRKNNDKHV